MREKTHKKLDVWQKSIDSVNMSWYAIYTKPKCEDSTARLLNHAGIETLSPKIRVLKRVRGKYVDAIEQLFPSYIFACFNADRHCHMIRYTRGVKYIVGKENPLAVHPEIIRTIRERMQGEVVVPVPEDVRKGDRIMIKEGPFKDFYGIFQRDLPGKARAMILLDALQCTLQIDSRSIKKA
jgi:transcriptional antiterminator RfaH